MLRQEGTSQFSCRNTLFFFFSDLLVYPMAQVLLREMADLGFVIAFRFYGRYPETGRSYYKPPHCESGDRDCVEGSDGKVGVRVRSPPRQPGLVTATTLLVPNISIPNLSVWIPTENIQGNSGRYSICILFFSVNGFLPTFEVHGHCLSHSRSDLS